MADLRYKVVVDDDEAKRKISELLKGSGVSASGLDGSADVKKSTTAVRQLTDEQKKLKQAQLENIESLRRLREERSKEISELNILKQLEQDAKTVLAEKKAATESLTQTEKELNIQYKQGQIELQAYNKELKEQAEERRKATAAEREATKAVKEAEKARKDAEREAEKQRKAAEKRRKELEKENSEYYQLNKALNAVRKEAKDVLAEMFKLERQGLETSAAYETLENKSKDLVKETQILDRGIKKIDATLGLHQRNVGDYGQAFSNISPIYASIDASLNLLGTSIKELAEGGGSAFAELGGTLIEFGTAIGKFLISPIGIAISILTGFFLLFQKNKQTVIDFNDGLLNVSKTTGLTGAALQSFSDAIIQLSRSLKTVSTDKLLEYASVAGQLGVKGTGNILAFTEALAKLETASDISGEEGASQIARLLQLTDGGVQNIKDFGDEIVKLGNNFPATESEILANATRIAQSTGIYKLGRQEILAYATATKSVGVEAELVGSSLGRTLGTLEGAIRTGKGLSTVLKLVGGTQAELSARFRQDASGVLMDFISGLNRTGTAAEDFNKNLSAVGITAQRDRDVIGSLASKGYAVLADAMDQVKDATGSMDAEFGTAAEKLVNQTQRIGIAWDNLVLGIENGQGRIGKASVAVIGFIADVIDGMSTNSLASDKLVDSYLKLENQTKYTEDAVRPLLKRYDELKSKTNLNKEEHTELRDIIQKVATLIPSAITEFNKYGEIIDINKTKITQFNDAQKQLVKDMNISTRNALGKERQELKRQRDQLISIQNNSLNNQKGTSFISKIFGLGQTEADRLKGIEDRTQRIAILTDKLKTNMQRTKDLGGNLLAEDAAFLAKFTVSEASKTTGNNNQEEVVKKNKEYWEKIVSDTQEAIDALEVSQKGSDIWNSLSKKLADAQKNVDKYSLSKDNAASKSAGRVAEKSRQATERQRALQLEIDKINEAASRNQLSRDESEVASVKDKYAKIREEVRKFYADPKNKGLRVDMSGLQRSENFEVSEATTRQETKQLAESLTVQKQLLDEYNAYAERTSKEEADKRYAAQLTSFKGYKERLQKEYMDLITLEKTSALGGFTGSSVKLTQAQEERAKFLRQLLDALDKEERERENNRFVEALKLASDYDAQLIEVQKKYQQALIALGNDATEERKAQLKKGLLEETSAIVSASLRQKVEWDKTFSTLQFMSKKATDSVLDDIQKRVDAEYKAGKLTKQEYDEMSREIGTAKTNNNLAKSWVASTGALDRYRDTVKKYGKDSIEAKQAQSEMFTALADDLAKAQHIVGLIGDSLSQLGIGGDGLQNTVNQIGNLVGGMGELAAGIASGNPISIISGSIKTLTSALDLFNTKDKKLQKQIDAYRDQLDGLGKAYDTLQRRISNSVGENYYSDSDKAIANLREQQRILAEMARAEEDKKKTDKEKVKGYYDEIDSINKQIEDIQKAITESLVQTTFKDLSASLADALVTAFEAGESAVDSLDETFDKFIKNALVNSLKLKMIEPIVNDMVNQLADYMKSNNNSLTGFNFSVWKDKIDGAGTEFTKTLEEAYKQLGLSKDGTSSGGGLKGSIQRELTESTASELTGLYRASFELQKKAFDESKSQGITISKQLLVAMDQLTALNAIQVNTAETVKRLDTAVSELQSINKNLGGRF
ncbi:phage tail tape measure protein [Sphingobacterium sp. InxBP1]|uniref:phage tail tape measure protein n=1 Tax=Sphingobacterium sp. InxBP1 TaxID=2870328 RepID=UPI002243730B|nr:phage tail tape measure protein [Sphingobacterium sp. InxBP1]MCW8314219.1 phage tail tape measure protein [Sphingobacterium sp. InxBP1]